MEGCIYLNILRPYMKITGMWPYNFENPFKQTLYNIYSFLVQGYFTVFVFLMILDLPLVLNESIIEMASSLGFVVLYIFTCLKIFVSQRKGIMDLIRRLAKVEEELLMNEHPDIKTMYLEHSKYVVKIYKIYVFTVKLCGGLYYIVYYIQSFYEWDGNDVDMNGYKRPLPINTFLPFNTNKYYTKVYLYQMSAVLCCLHFLVSTDCIIIGLTVSVIGQIKILQERFRNLEKYVSDPHDDLMMYAYVRKCIIEHQRIIDFVRVLDNSLKYLILADFFVKSVQLSSVLFQSMAVDEYYFLVFVYSFFLLVFVQIFLLYWHANEITLESMNIAYSIYDSKWYDYSEEVKQCLVIAMSRCTKPLVLHIGPLYDMSNEILMKIMKAAYTFITVMRRMISF